MLEVEIKVAQPSAEAAAAALGSHGFRLEKARRLESNWLWDDAAGSLRARGELLRLRRSGEAWLLTFKAAAVAGPHKSRDEIETGVADGEAARALLQALGYRETFVYERYRTTYGDGQGEAVIDETPLGVYLELEGPPAWIDAIAARLGFSRQDYILASYAGLFQEAVRKHGWRIRNFTFAEIALAENERP